MAYKLTVSASFDAAHYLPNHHGKCRNLHGHTWWVEAAWEFATLGEDGMGADFADLKARLGAILPDHTCLNDTLSFTPTAENLARWIAEQVGAQAVRVWESEGACAEYVTG